MAEKDNPNVIAPPPLIFSSGLLIGFILKWFFPFEFYPGIIFGGAGIFLLFSGLSLILIAWLQMRRAKTNIEPWKPTTAILSSGVYFYSRNPIYLGMLLIYLGFCLAFSLIWALPLLILILFAMHNGVILREEKYLLAKFGEEYRGYKDSVRRWI